MLAIPFPDLSPTLFEIDLGPISVALRWYALAYIAGILIGWRMALSCLRKPELWPAGRPPMTGEELERFMTWIVLGIIGGGRVGYCLFYQPGYYLSNPFEILAVWQGGMSFHGGLLGMLLAAILFSRSVGAPLLSTADMMGLATPPGLLFGRLANFVNAELWGRPTDVPWAVIFPGERAQDCGQLAGELCARHPSQLYEALGEGLVLWVLLWVLARSGALRRPGLITGLFLIVYGVTRFLVEMVRQPDAQFVSPGNPVGWALDLGGWGLTMGQILTLPMLVLGAYLVARARRSPLPA